MSTILNAIGKEEGFSLSNLTTQNQILPELDYKAIVAADYLIVYRVVEDVKHVNRILSLQRDLRVLAKYFIK